MAAEHHLQEIGQSFSLSDETQHIWLSSSTPGSGWGGLRFESGSSQRLEKMVLTAPQPVLVKMSLSKGNALAIKSADHTLYSETPDKGGSSKSWLSDKI